MSFSGSASPLAIVVLAAGSGTRMNSALHKVLHPIAGRPMLLHLLAGLEPLAAARTVIVVGNRREQIERALEGRGVAIAVQAEQLGTGHAVAQAEGALADFEGIVLVVYGDTPLVDAAILKKMAEKLESDAALAAVVLGFTPDDPGRYGRIIAGEDGLIARMVEYKDATGTERAVPLCNSGVMAVRSGDLWGWLGRIDNANAAGEYYLPDVVALARAEGRASAVIVTDDALAVTGVNARDELAALDRAWQARRRAELMRSGVTLIAPETVWFAHDTRIGRDVTIGQNVVFGPGVTIAEGAVIHAFSHIEGASIAAGAEIGPYARLRPGTEIGEAAKIGNFVETKKARLGAGAKVNHLSYVGDAEVGARANIGAGTITCNYDGFMKSRTTIGAGAFVGSNSALVAPIAIGEGAIVAAGSVLTRDVPADALAVARGRQETKPGWAARFRAMMKRHKDA